MSEIKNEMTFEQAMSRLEQMIRPNVVLFTSIGDAHAQGFSSLEYRLRLLHSASLSRTTSSKFLTSMGFIF